MQMQMWHWITVFGCVFASASQNISYNTTEYPDLEEVTGWSDNWTLSTRSDWTTPPSVPPSSTSSESSTLLSSVSTSGVSETAEDVRPPPPAPTTPLPPSPPQSQTDQDEYYSAYPDYSENPTQINSNRSGEGVLVPEPESVASERRRSEEAGDEEVGGGGEAPPVNRRHPRPPPPDVVVPPPGGAQVDLPDDSLADTDLHDHDLIDSVMYIYFGAPASDQRAPGRQVLIVGAVVGLVAQFLTLAGGVRRVRTKSGDSSLVMLINTVIPLTLTNLLFMLGVQATGSNCEGIAVSLHYLHLVVCCWFSANCVHTYRRIVNPLGPPQVPLYFALAWATPALPTLGCLWFNREAYETRSYCWMSVERGMMASFLLPISTLMLVNTCLAVVGLRLAKQDVVERRSLRIAASLLPMFSIVWFLGVVALEHSSSLVLPLLFVATSGFMNWFIFICWLPNDVSGWRGSEDDLEDDEDELYDQEVAKERGCLDDQPLLQEVVCGRRPPHDPYDRLQMDPIATISS